jgi:autotransporter-associated beta strand protein
MLRFQGMNIAFTTVWNAALGAWVAASELARVRGKRSSSAGTRAGRTARVAGPLLAAAGFAMTLPAWAACTLTGSTLDCTGTNPGWRGVPDGGTINNSGSIATYGDGTWGINVGANVTINNTGTISGSAGVVTGANSVINNNGGLISSPDRGIQVTNGSVTLTNSNGGVIEGVAGALLYGGGTIVNTGNSRITSTGNYLGLGFGGGSANITNTFGSTIEGLYSIYGQATSITLDNGGLLRGHVALDGGLVQQITLRTGSQVIGNLSIGSKAGSTLTLAGTGTQIHSQAVTGVTDFGGDLIKNDSGDWVINRSIGPRTATVNGGALGFASGGSFGTGTALTLAAAGTTLHTDSGSAVVGSLTGVAGSKVALAAGSSLRLADNTSTTIASDFSGQGALIKSGTGDLTLSGDNQAFTGSITANGGTLNAASAQAIGGAALGVAGEVLLTSPFALSLNNVGLTSNGSVLRVQAPAAVSFGGVVSGAGSLDLRSIGGTVSLLNNNTYAGGTRFANSNVVLGSNTALGTGVASIEGNTSLSGNAALTLGNAFAIGASNTLTVSGPALALDGQISGDGRLVKQGANALRLSNANTYAGGTTVAAGTLSIDNKSGSATGMGAVQVQSGATLAGSGAIAGAVNVASGARLSVGNDGVGTLSTGSLTLAAGSTLEMELGQAGSGGGAFNDLLNVEGDLSLAGTLNLAQSAGGTFGPGMYRLINYTGALTANALAIGSAPSRQFLSLQTGIANQINLINTGGLLLNMWDGGNGAAFNNGIVDGGSGTWRAGSPADSWTDADGIVNAGWMQDGFAVFAGKAGTVTVDNAGTEGAVRIGGAQFAVDGYAIDGQQLTITAPQTVVRVGDGSAAGAGMTATIDAAIGGAGGLVKSDLGTLVLGGSNSYAGGTTVKGGVLQISADSNLGAAGTGLALDGGTLRVSTGAALASSRAITLGAGGGTFEMAIGLFEANGSIGGAGGLTVKGSSGNALVLNAANTYAGGTLLQDGGSIIANVDGAFGSGDVRQETSGTQLGLAGSATAGSTRFTVGRAGSTDAGNLLGFAQTASAGAARIDLHGQGFFGGSFNAVLFGNASTAGNATIDNQGGLVAFGDAASAGSSTITVGANSLLGFAFDASAGTAKVHNQAGGLVYFANNAAAGTASITNATGGTVDVSGIMAPAGLGIGSLAGDGAVVLGATQLTLGGLNANDLISGAISDKGSLFPQPGSGTGGSIVKMGSGTLTLSAANSYTGGTTVAAGTLSVNNTSGSATGSGAVQVQGGATLAGSGTIAGDVTLDKGGVLSAGNAGVAGGIGTLTTGNLALGSGAVLNYDLGEAGVAGGTLNDLVNVNGNLQLDGTLNVAQTAGGSFGAGLYRLINYTGTLTDNGLDIGTAPTDASNLQVQTSVAQQVNLVNSDGVALNLWDGNNSANLNDGKVAGGSGTWRAGSPGDNWTDVNGVANGTWKQDGFAIFTGTAGKVTVDNTGAGGAVRIGGAQFAVDGYSIGGDALTIDAPATVVRVGDGTAASAGMTATIGAAIGGAGGLVKDDGGTLVLGGANSYTGGTTVKAGILQISADNNLGAAGTGLALDGGTLRIAPDVAPVFSARAFVLGAGGGTIDLSNSLYGVGGPITGSGLLTVTGKDGTLGLASANGYSGGTVLKDGARITTTVSGALGSGAVQQQGNSTVLSLLGSASAGGNTYTVGRAGSTDRENTLVFSQTATAGNATIALNATGWSTAGLNTVQFSGDASAGASTIVNRGGAVYFFENTSAGTAAITNADESLVAFGMNASAGSATIANQAGGLVRFAASATGAKASIANAAGGTLDVSGITAAGGTAVGALSGAGAVVLGATQLTLGGLNANDVVSGTVSDKGSVFAPPGSGIGGSIVKVGSGTLTLSGANSYTGGTTVAAGTLAVNNASGSATGTGAVQIQSGAGLAGNGTIAGVVNVASGGSVNPGSSPGTLTVGGLNLDAGSTLNYELGQAGVAGGTLNDLINVNGNLRLDGTLNVAESTGGKFGAGLYRLINYTGTLTDNGLDIGTAPTDTSKLFVQTSVANQINLLNADGLVLNLWDGSNSAGFNDGKIDGGTGTWRAGSPGDSWTTADGLANGTWAQDGFAIFGGKAGTVTVDNKGTGGAVRIGGAQFAVDGYTIDGDALTIGAPATTVRVGDGAATGADMTATIAAAIGGAGGLVKDDLGTLVLGGSNSYAGGTTVKAGILQIAEDANLGAAAGSLALAGGTTLRVTGTTDSTRAVSLGAGSNTFDIDAAQTLALNGAVSGAGGLRKTGAGTLRLGTANAYAGGTAVDAGTLATDIVGALGSGAASVASGATLQLGGGFNAVTTDIGNQGTVRFQNKSSAGSGTITNAAGGVLVFANGATADKATVLNQAGAQLRIDEATTGVRVGALGGAGNVLLGAKALTTGGLNANTAVSGTVSGAGGSVVKVGSGTLGLSGANTYTGGTTVAAGTLSANNTSGSATGTGAVQVQFGATLAGNGSVAGAVSIDKGGVLSAGNGGVGTLALGSLSLADGAVLEFDLGQANAAGGTLNDLVSVNGDLQLDGTLNVAQSKGGTFGAGIYRLIDYTGALTDNGLDVGMAPVAAEDLQVQTSVASQVNLVNRGGLSLNFWDGSDNTKYNDGKIAGGAGTWRVGVPGDGWTGEDGKINAAWVQNQFAVFGGKGGTVVVSDAGGTVRITGAQFAADGYVLQGDAIELGASGTVVRVGDGSGTDATRSASVNVALTGAGGLVKDDVGRLILGGTNSYTGGTTVKAGVLQGNAASLQGAIVNDAEVVFDQDKTGSYAGTMSGTGKLRKTGSGTLNLASANSHAGGTFVDAGTLATEVTGALGSGAASVASGATLQFGGKADVGSTAVANSGTVRLEGNASAGTATFTNASGGVLAFADSASAGKATVANAAGAQVRIDQATTGVSIGTLAGAGNVVLGAKALTLGALNANATLSGTIAGAGGSIVKVGSGTLTVSGANTYTGGTTVAAGTLAVNNTSGSATGTGAVRIQGGATLMGRGSIAGAVSVDKGGVLAAGNSPGTLTLGALALTSGAALNYELGQAGVPGGTLNDLIDVTGNLQLDGTLNIAQSAGGSFGPGLYRLMRYGGSFTDNGLDIGTVPGSTKLADVQVQTSVANQVNLVNRAGLSLNFWDGSDSTGFNDGKVAGGSGTWRAGSPQPSQDGWTDMNGKLNANWAQNQFAVFGGKAGTVTVDDAGGAVRIAGAQFATDGYVVQGDGLTLDTAGSVIRVGDGTAAGVAMTATLDVALSGAGGISKEDAGRLILGGTNSYTGGTTVKGGVLQGGAASLQGKIVNNAEVAFDQDKTAGTYAGTMSGTGKLRKIGAGTLTLAGANSYSGGTLVDAGTLATDTSGALGTGAVGIASGAVLQFGGKADAGKLAISNEGTLQLEDSATAAGASVSNAAGGQVRIDLATTGASIGSLDGAGDVVLGAKTLTTGALGSDNAISGAIGGAGGSLVKVGAGTLTLSGSATYSGETRVAAGTLAAGAANAFSAASSAVVASGATLDLAGFSQQMAGLANAGTVSLLGSVPGTTLTLTGPYVGNNGVLRLGAKLDNPGIADRLVLDGAAASASGHTTVEVTNLGGLGARTSGAGIEVVSALNGATTTAQTSKDAFALAGGHVDAGAFEYRLHAGDEGGEGENWYLRTEAEPGSGLPAYRAEASLFSALPGQLRQGSLAMLGNLRQRIGDDDVRSTAGSSPSMDGTQGHRRAWGRLISTDMDIRQGGTVAPQGEGRVTGLQAGTDLWATKDWRAGLYVGHLDGDTSVRGFASGLSNGAAGRNDLRSQYLGLYGTYTSEDGFYADAVLQAGRHRYTVQPMLGAGATGKGNSLLASIEVGKAFALGASGWSLEPQLQLVHQRLRLDDVQIAGALVQQDADSGWTARAGLRIKGSFATGAGTLQPYARLNVYRSSKGNDVAQFVSPAAITPVGAPIGSTSAELAAGFTLAVSQRTSLYGELGKLWATGGAARVGSSINAGMGVRVKW